MDMIGINASDWGLDYVRTKWEYIVDTYGDEDEIFLPIVVGWLIAFVAYWTSGLILLMFEKKHFPKAFDKKWQDKRPMQFEATNYNPSFKSLVKVSTFNWVAVILPTLYVLQKVLKPLGFGINASRELPSLPQMIMHMVIAPYMVDLFFFHSHYVLHLPWFYQRIHKVHHEFKAPYGLASIYAHWFEALVGNTLAIMGVAFVLRVHCIEWWAGLVLGWVETNTAHSGLHLPWSQISQKKLKNKFGGHGYTDFHDYHHQFFKGNYGHGYFTDRIYGTDKGWKKYCQSRNDKISQ